MQRRRQASISSLSNDEDDHVLPSSRAPSRHQSSLKNGGKQPRFFAKFNPINLCIIALLLIILNVQLFAYRSIVVGNSGPAFGSESASNTNTNNFRNSNKDAKRSLHHKTHVINDAPPKINIEEPTRPPSPKSSYSPTQLSRLWRVRKAKTESQKSYDFWKINTPDPVPPLPPDVDPITGEKLPPVVAYVTTITKCIPKSQGTMVDGAAALLHSIRRNSYGWVPIQQQMKNSTTHDNQNNESSNNDDSIWPRYGGQGGRYRFKAYVIVDPDASTKNRDNASSGECSRILQKLGYTILHRPPLVTLFELENATDYIPNGDQSFYDELKSYGYVGEQRPKEGPYVRPPDENPNRLRRYIDTDGCCGYKEMLKLHVYGMVEHELAVHLDFDSLVLRPMDDLFDTMLGKQSSSDSSGSPPPIAKGPNTKTPDFSKPIDAAFTRDYNSVKTPSPNAPVGYQGGFLVVRPSLEVLERYRAILRRGEFLLNPRLGWGGKFGGFYGDVTFQGVLPYYYEMVAPKGEHNEIELDRCIYNQMADNPRKSTHKFPKATPLDPEKMGYRDTNVCRDGRDDCSDTDCQRVHPKDSITAHFTFCHKPWDCSDGLPGTVAFETCSGLLREWYGVRRELEEWWLLSSNIPGKTGVKSWWSDPDDQRSFYWKEETISRVHKQREGILNVDQYSGYCDAFGEDGYRSLVHPDAWFEEKENVVKRAIENLHRHRPAENNFLRKISLE